MHGSVRKTVHTLGTMKKFRLFFCFRGFGLLLLYGFGALLVGGFGLHAFGGAGEGVGTRLGRGAAELVGGGAHVEVEHRAFPQLLVGDIGLVRGCLVDGKSVHIDILVGIARSVDFNRLAVFKMDFGLLELR